MLVISVCIAALVCKGQGFRTVHRLKNQQSSTDFVESKMANIESKFMIVGYHKILAFSLFCLSLFQIFKLELIC